MAKVSILDEDYSDIPLDTLVIATNSIGSEALRYFAGTREDRPYCFSQGCTSTTAHANFTHRCDKVRPATPTDIEHLRPKLLEWCAKPKGGCDALFNLRAVRS